MTILLKVVLYMEKQGELLSEQISNRMAEANCLWIKENRLEEALVILKEITEEISDIANKKYRHALGNTAFILALQRYFEPAEEIYNKLLRYATENNSNRDIFINLHQLGMVSRLKTNYDKALMYHKQEWETIMRSGETDARYLSANRYELGYNNFLKNNIVEALKFMQEAFDLAIQSGDRMCIACSHRGLGEIYAKLGDVIKAVSNFNEAIKIFTEADDSQAVSEVQDMLFKIENCQQKA
jgi:tetratricopeptide (TPR) repeat protein